MIRFLLASAFLCGTAWAAPSSAPFQGPQIKRTGKAGVVLNQGDAANYMIPLNFKGGKCDGTLHTLASVGYTTVAQAQQVFGVSRVTSLTQGVDSLALDAAMDEVRSNSGSVPGTDFTIAKYAKFVAGTGQCVIDSTVMADMIKGRGVHLDFSGAHLVGQTNGQPVVDMSGNIGVVTDGLTIACSSTNPPNIGLLSARPGTGGSTYNVFNQLEATGYCTKAAYLNLNAEDTTINQGIFGVSAPGATAVIEDGDNHNNVCSTDPAVGCLPVDHNQSFNTFVCNDCKIHNTGDNTFGIWQANTHSHIWNNVYINNAGVGATPAITKYFGGNAVSINDQFNNVHFEQGPNGGPFVLWTGVASINAPLFHFSDHVTQANPFWSVLDTGVTSIKLYGAEIGIGTLGVSGAKWLDQPTLYTISGKLFSGDGVGYNVSPTTFTGLACTPACPPTASAIGALIDTSQVIHSGSVSGLNVTLSGGYSRSLSSGPTITISNPPSPNLPASAHVTAFTINSVGNFSTSTASGFVANEIVTDVSDNCPVHPAFKIKTVDGSGKPTSKPVVVNRGYCIYPPAVDPIAVSGFSGTSLFITGSNVGVAPGLFSTVIDQAGTGFVPPITATFNGGALSRAQAQVALNGKLDLSGGGTTISLDFNGVNVTDPIVSGVLGYTGFVQNLSSIYAVAATYTYSSMVVNGSNTYVVTNVGCTAADATGPTATLGKQTIDGCDYQFLQSGSYYTEMLMTDQGADYYQPLTLFTADQAASVQIGVRAGSPNGVVTANQGSLYLDTTSNLWINTDGATTWSAFSGAYKTAYAGLVTVPVGLREVLCTDCRKPGEAVNAGTGMLEFYDGAAWISSAGTLAAR